ncbi:MAG: STAS domain-containing protein [Leptolyngbya sp. SIO4C1]|nr:STAS domain-containing protein [Leptolyngbya sp. SIO4C1]
MVDTVKVANFETTVNDSIGIIYLPPSFAVVAAVAFKQKVQAFFAQHPHVKELVLDFGNTHFIDSSGIGALVIGYRLSQAQSAQVRLKNVPSQVMMALSMTELDQVFDIEPLPEPSPEHPSERLSLERLPATHPSVRSRAKRFLDIVGALVGLVISSVLFIPIAIAIKLEDGGPLFFKQTRCSWMGKRFTIFKFRSMVTDAEQLKTQVANELEGPLFKNEKDPRITNVGRFLRKTSLDELPQFWNVLRGDMSLVGTRPPTPDEIEQYEVPEWRRLNVKPGMTGEWQVNGRSTVKKFEDVIRLDLKYQENWSLLYDIKLIVKTVLVLFSKRSGAA